MLILSAVTPPVGIKRIVVYGPQTDLIYGNPPACSAGKNFAKSSPSSKACSISLAEESPGAKGMPLSRQCFTTLGLSPGATQNFAPALYAASACSQVNTVPAPTSISGYALVILLITSSAPLALKVTSAQFIPPSRNAFASFSAFSTLSSLITGTMPTLPRFSTSSSNFCFISIFSPYARKRTHIFIHFYYKPLFFTRPYTKRIYSYIFRTHRYESL